MRILSCGLSIVIGLISQAGICRAQATAGIQVDFGPTAAALAGHPAMISAIRHDSVVAQIETVLRSGERLSNVPVGQYDVRVESEGAVTEVKRGVQVLPGRGAQLQFALRPGQGVHIVEYATGGISREEVAARLAQLEAAVTELQHAASPRRP
jgi:hypothetical protein